MSRILVAPIGSPSREAEVLVLESNHDKGDRAGLCGTADQISCHAPCTVSIVK